MVAATDNNLADIGGPTVGAFVADAGYWSPANATLEKNAEVLIAPMPATQGITDPNDPRIAQRKGVIARLDAGEITTRQAAQEMGVSTVWARKLLRETTGPAPPTRPGCEQT